MTASSTNTVTVCTPAGDIGYGFDEDALASALDEGVDAIAVQGTSTDPGPYYLGTGTSYIPESGIVDDLKRLIPIALSAGVPLLASMGGAGVDSQVDRVVDRLRHWSESEGIRFRLATIRTSVPPQALHDLIRHGTRIPALPEAARHLGPFLTDEQVDAAENIVVQVGAEPFMAALNGKADVVLSGRALDVALFAAVPMMRGIPPDISHLMGKTLECGGQVGDPGSLITGAIGEAGVRDFTISPTDPSSSCTPRSVMAHVLYEEPNGSRLGFPSGEVDLADLRLEPISARTVRIRGSRWIAARQYTLKMEGARQIGHRAVCVAGIRDERVLQALPYGLARLHDEVERRFHPPRPVNVHLYGKSVTDDSEVGVLIDVVADAPEHSMDIANWAKGFLLHFGFPGRRTTSGNLALAFSPNVLDGGAVYEFNIFHLLPADDPMQYCRLDFVNMGPQQ